MVQGRFVAYYRVSTAKQGRSGLGLDAQRASVRSYLNGGNWTLLAEHTEVESEKVDSRPELAKARGVRLGGWRGGPIVDHVQGTKALQQRARAFADTIGPIVREMREAGSSLRHVAAEFAARGIRTSRGGVWSADAVRRALLRGMAPV